MPPDFAPDRSFSTGGILSAIGRTPLIKLDRLYSELPVTLYAKLEFLNPGGSTKDRPARTIIEHAMASDLIGPGTTVVESSSGNMGIGLAQICCYHGLKFRCVIDPKTSRQNIQLLKTYGAIVDTVHQPHPITGEFLPARLERVRELLSLFPNSFWPNQYANQLNARAHHQTAAEIIDSLDHTCDWVFLATSTCGTLRGCAEYFRLHSPRTRIIAVDAEGSVIFGGRSRNRLLPGHGASVVPGLFSSDLTDHCVRVSDRDCVAGCRLLAKREAVLAGASSGAVVSAISRVSPALIENSTCVLLLPDRGERYLDTVYNDDWVRQHFEGPSDHFETLNRR